jgi:Xaa-Pro aminopeptidase
MCDRLDRLRQAVSALGADAAIVSHSANRRYLAGFPAVDLAPDETAAVVLVSAHDAVLYTSPTNLPWAAATVNAPTQARPWERPWTSFLGKELERLGVRNVAFEDHAMTVAVHGALLAAASDVSLIPAGNAFHALRKVKDDQEIALIAEAARITDAALAAAIADLQPGVTERALAWRVEQAMHELGADGPAFPTSVAAGPHGARPHHDPTDHPLAAGEPIVIDLGATIGGYCADLTRTIVIGEPPPLFTERYNCVVAAQEAALRGVRAGMTGRDADALARDALAAAGYGEQFVHGLGHGVGLLIHEGPSLGPRSDELLEAGQVITIEPGVYFEGWGGIRIEDLCVVTATGLDILSHSPK